jgi:NADPH-dependent curcumin reductase CurA
MKLTVQGFIILDYASRFAEGRAYLADLRSKGKIDYAYSIKDGLENCVKALEEVFHLLFNLVHSSLVKEGDELGESGCELT